MTEAYLILPGRRCAPRHRAASSMVSAKPCFAHHQSKQDSTSLSTRSVIIFLFFFFLLLVVIVILLELIIRRSPPLHGPRLFLLHTSSSRSRPRLLHRQQPIPPSRPGRSSRCSPSHAKSGAQPTALFSAGAAGAASLHGRPPSRRSRSPLLALGQARGRQRQREQ